jgi:predicted N-acyltransferase
MNKAGDEHHPSHDQAATAAGDLRISVASAIGDIGAGQWDACANPGSATLPAPTARTSCEAAQGASAQVQATDQEIVFNPFLSHAFLGALETSKSVGSRTGWQVQHMLVTTPDGTLVAAAPCYLKSHSRGEYVFDYGWAEAYANAGGNYYPKLQVAVPFTPATGPRLLVRPGPRADTVRRALAAGIPLSGRTRLPAA